MLASKTWDFTVLLPKFPDTRLNICECGAVSGGNVSNTKAINEAIRKISEQGGGHVVIPAGIFLSGPITLLSNVDLHLERGAMLLFSHDESEYPIIRTNYEGESRIRAVSPVNARDAENIAITGEGVIDGNGHLWRLVKRSKMTDGQWNALLKKGGYTRGEGNKSVWFPSKSSLDGHMNPEINADDEDALKHAKDYFDYYRPVMVSIVGCKKVLIEGVTLQNSPAWNLHPLFCEHFTLKDAMIRNPWNAQNGDGLDLESCKYANIINTSFDVGDDAICMKSGKNAPARKIQKPTEYVNIYGCTVYHGHGGFVVGSEMSRGIRRVSVENCLFIGTDIGIRFKSTLGRGGVVEDIIMKGINMTDIPKQALLFTMAYDGASDANEASDEDVPVFRNIIAENINALNCGEAFSADGLSMHNISDICVKNSRISAKRGICISKADNIHFENLVLANSISGETVSVNETAGDGFELMEDK